MTPGWDGVEYSTVQYSTVQYSTVQYRTVHGAHHARAAVEQVPRHPHHLCLHLPDAGEGVRVERVGVGGHPEHRGHHLHRVAVVSTISIVSISSVLNILCLQYFSGYNI